jgi:hypothetical protein
VAELSSAAGDRRIVGAVDFDPAEAEPGSTVYFVLP